MAFVDELRERLQSKQGEWEKAREDVRIAKERETRLRDEIEAIQVLLNAEEPKSRRQDNVVLVPSVPASTETNKAEAVRVLIQEQSSVGVTPPRIRELLAQKGILVGVSYIYGILMRAKKNGYVTERNGKYYPVENAKAAS